MGNKLKTITDLIAECEWQSRDLSKSLNELDQNYSDKKTDMLSDLTAGTFYDAFYEAYGRESYEKIQRILENKCFDDKFLQETFVYAVEQYIVQEFLHWKKVHSLKEGVEALRQQYTRIDKLLEITYQTHGKDEEKNKMIRGLSNTKWLIKKYEDNWQDDLDKNKGKS